MNLTIYFFLLGLTEKNYINIIFPQKTQSFLLTKTVCFSIDKRQAVTVDVFNIRGQAVATLVNDVLPAGKHTAVWNGVNENQQKVASGVYFSRMKAGNTVQHRKAILMK